MIFLILFTSFSFFFLLFFLCIMLLFFPLSLYLLFVIEMFKILSLILSLILTFSRNDVSKAIKYRSLSLSFLHLIFFYHHLHLFSSFQSLVQPKRRNNYSFSFFIYFLFVRVYVFLIPTEDFFFNLFLSHQFLISYFFSNDTTRSWLFIAA